jgi:hypothetical protein
MPTYACLMASPSGSGLRTQSLGVTVPSIALSGDAFSQEGHRW